MTDDLDAETLARGLAMGEYRVLRRVQVDELDCGPTVEADTLVAAVVDVETSGLDPAEDGITELALRRIRFDGEGRVVKVDRLYSWLENPGGTLPDDVVRLTGITNEMLADKQIDEAQATKLLSSADVIISHNAAFDRPFIDKRLPAVRGRPWACSCEGIDWKTFGFNGGLLAGSSRSEVGSTRHIVPPPT
jgi:DNA polymerase-3 subunit epsilon